MAKKKKHKWTWLRYRKGDHAGGTAVVLGGIGLLDEGEHRYQVCVGALGLKPVKKEKK